MVQPEDVADEAMPVPASTEVPAEETKAPKKKKKMEKGGCQTREVPVRAARGQGQRNVQGQTPETPA